MPAISTNGSAKNDASSNGKLTCWLLDTRMLWPGDKIEFAVRSTSKWSRIVKFDNFQASKALDLISPQEKAACMRKMFIEDAKMSLGSALLKRLFVSQALDVPWKDVNLARRGDPKHGKPCALLPDGSFASVDFNVSHQAGLITLIGWTPSQAASLSSVPVLVGTDIVCVNERDDYRTIDQEGFDSWVDIYEEVFSEVERWDMKFKVDSITLLDGQVLSGEAIGRNDRCVRRDEELVAHLPSGQPHAFSSDIVIEAKLRRFYAFFCYKEAYIKLAGEALLAPWLKDLEFQNVKSPKAGTVPRCSTHGTWGEKLHDVDITLHGKTIGNVRMAIQAFEENYMIATAVSGDTVAEVPPFEKLNLEHDIMAYAMTSAD